MRLFLMSILVLMIIHFAHLNEIKNATNNADLERPNKKDEIKYSNPFEWIWKEYKIFAILTILFILSSLITNIYFCFIYFGVSFWEHERILVMEPTL